MDLQVLILIVAIIEGIVVGAGVLVINQLSSGIHEVKKEVHQIRLETGEMKTKVAVLEHKVQETTLRKLKLHTTNPDLT